MYSEADQITDPRQPRIPHDTKRIPKTVLPLNPNSINLISAH